MPSGACLAAPAQPSPVLTPLSTPELPRPTATPSTVEAVSKHYPLFCLSPHRIQRIRHVHTSDVFSNEDSLACRAVFHSFMRERLRQMLFRRDMQLTVDRLC